MGVVGGAADDVEEDSASLLFPSFSLLDSPILLLLYFHKSLRAELSNLRRLSLDASRIASSHLPDFVVDLRRRFEFLNLVCKYHCAAEDEVIFRALDVHIKNVVCTYSLEHESIDDLFCSTFNCLDVLLMENVDISCPLQELVLSISTIRASICRHMLKEEKQIFPLLIRHLSSKEQNALVWQFICSVPLIVLEDLFPWMFSFLSSVEQKDVMSCILKVLPKEKLLQEVVLSWMGSVEQFSFQPYHKYEKGAQFPNMIANFNDVLKVEASNSYLGEEQQLKKAFTDQQFANKHPIDGMHLWHGTIRRDLEEIQKELNQFRGSSSFPTIASIIVHLKFFINVLVFYSNALDRLFYPVVNELAPYNLPHSWGKFLDESQIEGLQRLLYTKSESAGSLDDFVVKLYAQLELFVRDIDKHIEFLEKEVLNFIRIRCSYEMQKWLLYTSLQMMPLGLLKCMVTWFSAHLSENESKTILHSIKGIPKANESFQSLLLEWVRIGYSGKTSIEKFRRDLQKMFDGSSSLLPEKHRADSQFSYLQSEGKIGNRLKPQQLELKPAMNAENFMSISAPSSSNSDGNPEMLYSSGINLQIFFPRTSKKLSCSKLSARHGAVSTISETKSKPMDHIFFFHKALKKDLEYLISMSVKLEDNNDLLGDFQQRFHLLWSLYQIHSDSEDEFAFPALEANKMLQNISHSYSVDHKLEMEHFNRISLTLSEISGLQVAVSRENSDSLDQNWQRYHQLCMELQSMCISVHKLLSDHVHREEVELWPLFRECLSASEQQKIVGHMLGRMGAEILQKMIPWLMAYLTSQEQHAMMSLWVNATKNTMFSEWLGEWWEGMKMYNKVDVEDESNVPSSLALDPLEVISSYLLNEAFDEHKNIFDRGANISQDFGGNIIEKSGTSSNVDDKAKPFDGNRSSHKCSDDVKFAYEIKEEGSKTEDNKAFQKCLHSVHQADKASQCIRLSLKCGGKEHLLSLSQGELEATIRRVSRDTKLDPQKKSYIIQNLLMSRWVASQKESLPQTTNSITNTGEVPGRCPSYRDPLESTLGCKHYKRNCKLLAACCNKLYTCVRCHDEMVDHSIDRKTITKMMCMKCLTLQPIGHTCSTVSCNNLSMARYYCRICKLFDDERVIYHCPFCNLCRLGKGLGIDYFHCMNCNACMSRSLSVHTCREKCFEDNCPICHEYIFTSSSPVKSLPCGHLMHSACFQDYTCTHYTCPICSKSLGDMQVYFGMLDALLAEEKIPEEYSGKTQDILCNDCERKGLSSFHWLYHKCSHCGSYNTRLV